tara:strand:- start:735 stop:965 length:231 start_codon:yes stop_codon:yes gene_type:complete
MKDIFNSDPLASFPSIRPVSYTIMNPHSGEPIMERIPKERVDEMTRYFAWMCGVRPASLVVKKTSEKPLQTASEMV